MASDKPWSTVQPALSRVSLNGLELLGFEAMTPVQSAAIPLFLDNKDVAVEAVTGSGKTLAFVIPVIEIVSRREKAWSRGEVGALVVTPTRELATQIALVFQSFPLPNVSLQLLIGGQDVQTDIVAVNNEGAGIVVATPGRLVDLLERNDCRLASGIKSLEVLVFDEADRLLELGFQTSITTIMSYLPKQRRTGLFSATLGGDVAALMRAGMRNPVTVSVREKHPLIPTPKTLTNYFLPCTPESKFSLLLSLLLRFSQKKVIVFFTTCACVNYFSDLTRRLCPALDVTALHGKMHTKRQKLFENFRSSASGVIMCTDVLARGVDFPSVDWVVQFDPPSCVKAFVHRCGRTARMGAHGSALLLLLPSQLNYVEFLQLNQHISLEEYECSVDPLADAVARGRDMAASDRELFEKGKRAFVSFLHSYYKHECRLIFQARELELAALAQGFALPHLPKMPELRGRDLSGFTPHSRPAVEIPFKSKKMERQRQLKLAGLQGQSSKTVVKNKPKVVGRRKKNDALSEADLEELATEARLLKKFRSGKISKQELEASLDDTAI